MKDDAPGNAAKFRDPFVTADGSQRASVPFRGAETLWFNTGTLCNITCANCYIESSPTNDALVYLTLAEVARFLDEVEATGQPTTEIGFTGGEPFMNPEAIAMIEASLARGFEVLVLTNAMAPIMRPRVQEGLKRLAARYGDKLILRVSLDHHERARHDAERGAGSYDKTLEGMDWLRDTGIRMAVAGRSEWHESDAAARAGYAALFAERGYNIDAADPAMCVIFPEMDATVPVPEITTACWGILGKEPSGVMCANSRMVVHHKGAPAASVIACTLLPYAEGFDLGATLTEAARPVQLNHPHCAKFCVLGGASCSA
ncbi:radical SAM protein [Mesobacterium pallidum]|uniref:radical SAM protein n=1 Tax=Mesobacterium pallidum TaxID=2872037 RepID=UPI001EE2FF97|nr:radical SAM protein [Mesobacterium pallidum]